MLVSSYIRKYLSTNFSKVPIELINMIVARLDVYTPIIFMEGYHMGITINPNGLGETVIAEIDRDDWDGGSGKIGKREKISGSFSFVGGQVSLVFLLVLVLQHSGKGSMA